MRRVRKSAGDVCAGEAVVEVKAEGLWDVRERLRENFGRVEAALRQIEQEGDHEKCHNASDSTFTADQLAGWHNATSRPGYSGRTPFRRRKPCALHSGNQPYSWP